MSSGKQSRDETPGEAEPPPADDRGAETTESRLARRDLLRVAPAVGLAGLAGCSALDGVLEEDGQAEASTTTFGYGGSPTDTASATTGATTQSPTADPTTAAETTATTAAGTAAGDFGEQGYGQYGYGGTQ